MTALGAEGRRFESCLPDQQTTDFCGFSSRSGCDTSAPDGTDRIRAEAAGTVDHGIVTEHVRESFAYADMPWRPWLESKKSDPVEQMHYSRQCLEPWPHYSGTASIWSQEEANAILWELLQYFEPPPPPPCSLPGRSGFIEREVFDLLQLGYDYFRAVVDRRHGTQWNLYREMETALRGAYDRGYAGASTQYEARILAEATARAERHIADYLNSPPAVDNSLVYFIGSESGPIKIGKAVSPEQRLKTLQTGHFERLTILATAEGGYEAEGAYHKRFAEHRKSGEWFTRCPEIEAEIARLNANPSLTSILNDGESVR